MFVLIGGFTSDLLIGVLIVLTLFGIGVLVGLTLFGIVRVLVGVVRRRRGGW